MIIQGFLSLVYLLISSVISLFNVPGLTDFNLIMQFVGDMLNSIQHMIDLFLPWEIVQFGLPLIVAIISFKETYMFTMWILRKIPILGIE